MTLDDSIQGFRLRVLQAAQRSGNVSATCRRYDVSRTVFYRWRARLTRYGADGLHPTRRTARRGRAPELTVTDERRVIAEALAWPTRGPQWVSDRLARPRARHRAGDRLAGLAPGRAQSPPGPVGRPPVIRRSMPAAWAAADAARKTRRRDNDGAQPFLCAR